MGNIIQKVTILLDADDARAFHAAVAKRQSMRVANECILPEGESDTLGLIIGEICRDWLDAH